MRLYIVIGFSLFLVCFVMGLKSYIHHKEQLAYNKGVQNTEMKYKKYAEETSIKLSQSISTILKEEQQKLAKNREINNEQVVKTVKEYVYIGECHTPDGIRLLNEKINSRSTNP